MAHLIAFALVEKQYMVGISHGLIAADMPHVNTSIGKNEGGCRGAFFRAAVATGPDATDVSHRDYVGV
jgi:hypothetical protein